MKTIEVTFKLMKNNIKKNYKNMFAIIVLCTIVGIITGMIIAHSYDPVKTTNMKPLQEHVDLQSLERDGGYYYNAFLLLKERNDYIKAYLSYFEQVDLNTESRNEIAEVEKEVFDYQKDFKDAVIFFKENPPCLADEVESTIEFYTKKLKSLEEAKEKSISELDEVITGKYTDDYKESQKEALYQNISTLEENKDVLTKYINIIEGSTQNELIQNEENANLILAMNIEELNQIIDDFNSVMERIAERENYEIIYNKRLLSEYANKAGFNNELDQSDILNDRVGQAIIYAKSIAGLDLKKERFLATLTFFMLFGVIISIIIGAVYVPPKRKKII